MAGVFIKDEREREIQEGKHHMETQAQREDSHVETGRAEMGVRGSQKPRNSWGYQMLEENRKHLSWTIHRQHGL